MNELEETIFCQQFARAWMRWLRLSSGPPGTVQMHSLYQIKDSDGDMVAGVSWLRRGRKPYLVLANGTCGGCKIESEHADLVAALNRMNALAATFTAADHDANGGHRPPTAGMLVEVTP